MSESDHPHPESEAQEPQGEEGWTASRLENVGIGGFRLFMGIVLAVAGYQLMTATHGGSSSLPWMAALNPLLLLLAGLALALSGVARACRP